MVTPLVTEKAILDGAAVLFHVCWLAKWQLPERVGTRRDVPVPPLREFKSPHAHQGRSTKVTIATDKSAGEIDLAVLCRSQDMKTPLSP